MAPPVTRARANWAVEQVTGLVEFWALVSKYRGIVGTCQLLRMCKALHEGGMEHLRTLLGLVVSGGDTGDERVGDTLRLNMATMRWEPMAALVVLGGATGSRCHLECGNTFFFRGGGGVCGSPATVMRRDLQCSRDRDGRERQRRGASAPDRRI
jgi:hypothetical protein